MYDDTWQHCILEFVAEKTDTTYVIEGMSQWDILYDQLPKSPHVLRVSHSKDGGLPVHKVVLNRFNLSNLPLIYTPFILRNVEYMGVNATLTWMREVMSDLFPESRRYIEGYRIESEKIKKGRGQNRDVYLLRTLNAWKAKTTVPHLQEYLWRNWFKMIGEGAIGIMPRSSPGARKRLATFTGSFTIKACHPKK